MISADEFIEEMNKHGYDIYPSDNVQRSQMEILVEMAKRIKALEDKND